MPESGGLTSIVLVQRLAEPAGPPWPQPCRATPTDRAPSHPQDSRWTWGARMRTTKAIALGIAGAAVYSAFKRASPHVQAEVRIAPQKAQVSCAVS
jgi:hypothetical protein